MDINLQFFNNRRGHRTVIALIVVVMLALWVFFRN